MGVANDHSIAWGIASALHQAGAELAFTYQGDTFARRVEPLAKSVDAAALMDCDVTDEASLDAAFSELDRTWGGLDFLVHAIAFSNKDELAGRYVDTSLDNFLLSLNVSCYSFTAVARRAAALMSKGHEGSDDAGSDNGRPGRRGGAMITLTYDGSTRVQPNYNVMGVAKAALECSVRYIAADLGPDQIRVNAISAGPMRTLAGSAVGSARQVYKFTGDHAPLRRNIFLEDVGGAGLYLLSDLSQGVTGETHYVDAGFNAVGIPKDALG
jgi:enoyl-[acyl-carrier protein] reductase I